MSNIVWWKLHFLKIAFKHYISLHSPSIVLWIIFQRIPKVDLYLSKFNFTNLQYNVAITVMNFGSGKKKKNMAHLSISSANKQKKLSSLKNIYLLWLKPLVSLVLGDPEVNWLLLIGLGILSALSLQGLLFCLYWGLYVPVHLILWLITLYSNS